VVSAASAIEVLERGEQREYYLFFADGRVYRGLPVGGLASFDFDRARHDEPERCGRYAIMGDQIRLQFPGRSVTRTFAGDEEGVRIGDLTYTRVDRGYDGLRLDGIWGINSDSLTWPGPPAPEGGKIDWSFIFSRGGRFREQLSRSGGADTNPTPRLRVRHGTYAIGANALELSYADGERRRFTFFHDGPDAGDAEPFLIVLDGAQLRLRGEPYAPYPDDPRIAALQPVIVVGRLAANGQRPSLTGPKRAQNLSVMRREYQLPC
jgi:hypothetical protein